MEETEFLTRVKECHGLILKLIGLYAYSPQDRNDLYQEILLNAWKSLPQFRREAKFSTWLYQLALNTILTANRKKKPLSYHDDLAGFAIAVNPDNEEREAVKLLYSAIRRLPEVERAVISLHLEGYPNREVADMTGIKINYMAVKLSRIKAYLQTYLNKQ